MSEQQQSPDRDQDLNNIFTAVQKRAEADFGVSVASAQVLVKTADGQDHVYQAGFSAGGDIGQAPIIPPGSNVLRAEDFMEDKVGDLSDLTEEEAGDPEINPALASASDEEETEEEVAPPATETVQA